MPLLEAMACGVPVIASRRGSIVEVAGEAAYYVDPDSPEAIAAGIEKVLKDFTLRNRMIQLGLKQAAKFSWQRTAVETAAVYQRILKQDRGILCKEQG